jgi:hypothetical protein
MIRLIYFCIIFASAFAFSATEESCGESFEGFLEKYQTDKEFRKEHSLYPLMISYIDSSAEPEPKIIKISISNENDMQRSKIPSYPVASEIKSVPFERRVSTRSNGITIVTFAKPDTDYKFSFRFFRNKSCWYLVEVNDETL